MATSKTCAAPRDPKIRRTDANDSAQHCYMMPILRCLVDAFTTMMLVTSSTQAFAHEGDGTVSLAIENVPAISSHPAELSLVESSTESVNTSLNSDNYCLGDDYGYGLVAASCQNIVPNSFLDPLDDTPKTWAPHRATVVSDFPLPQRFVSREYLKIYNPGCPSSNTM